MDKIFKPCGKDWTDTPGPQMSKLNNVCVTCHAVGFDFCCPPVSRFGRRKQRGGAGEKVVQAFNILSIYCSDWSFLGLPLRSKISMAGLACFKIHVHITLGQPSSKLLRWKSSASNPDDSRIWQAPDNNLIMFIRIEATSTVSFST